jgi:nucleotide-binding universal stress UspA family protein
MKLYPFKRILVCTDLSPNSDLVIKAAAKMRQRNGATMDVLCVTEFPPYLKEVIHGYLKEDNLDLLFRDIHEVFKEKVADQLSRCEAEGNILIQKGGISEMILKLAHNGQYDLIIMGHGRSSLNDYVLGSNAYKIIAGSPVPVLVIKEQIYFTKVAGLVDETRQLDRIIIGSLDFYRAFQFGEIEFINLWINLPAPVGSPLTEFEAKEKLLEEVNHFKANNEKPIIRSEATNDLKLANPLAKILTQENVNVAVIKKFSYGNLKRLYIGSTSKRLLEIFSGNLLVLPP